MNTCTRQVHVNGTTRPHTDSRNETHGHAGGELRNSLEEKRKCVETHSRARRIMGGEHGGEPPDGRAKGRRAEVCTPPPVSLHSVNPNFLLYAVK